MYSSYTQRAFEDAIVLYNYMKANAFEIEGWYDDPHLEFRGSPYYAGKKLLKHQVRADSVVTLLKSMECIYLAQPGRRGTPSTWHLLTEPTPELFQSSIDRRPTSNLQWMGKYRSTLALLKRAEARIAELEQQASQNCPRCGQGSIEAQPSIDVQEAGLWREASP